MRKMFFLIYNTDTFSRISENGTREKYLLPQIFTICLFTRNFFSCFAMTLFLTCARPVLNINVGLFSFVCLRSRALSRRGSFRATERGALILIGRANDGCQTAFETLLR